MWATCQSTPLKGTTWLQAAEEASSSFPNQERRALEDEPLLAARMVVEDCMCLLLDVDDIDRLWAAGACTLLDTAKIIAAALQ